MKRDYYYVIAQGDYGRGFLHVDGEMSLVLRDAPRVFEHKAAAELLAEHFMAEFGGRAVVRAVSFSV